MTYSNDAFQQGTFQQGWMIWEGIEQEGPYKGLKTLFIGSDCLVSCFETYLPQLETQYEQIYINPGFFNQEGAVDAVLNLNFESRIIMIAMTVDRYVQLRKQIPQAYFTLILPQFNELKETRGEDVVRIDSGNMVTYSVRISDMIKTSEVDYKDDKVIV